MPIDSYWGHNIRTWYGRMVRFYKGFQVRVAENDNAQDFWTIKPGLNSEGDEALLIKLSAIDGTDYDDLDESSADRVIDFSQRRQVVVGETTLAAGSHTYNISDVAQYAYLDFLVPGDDRIYYARVPKARLTGPFPATLYGVELGGDDLYTIDPADASVTLIGSFGSSPGTNMEGLTSHGGLLYGLDNNSDNLYTIDPADASIALVGSFGGGTGNWRALASHNGTLYAMNNTNLYTMDPTDASITLVGSLGSGIWQGLASHNGTLYAAESSDQLYSVNPTDASTH